MDIRKKPFRDPLILTAQSGPRALIRHMHALFTLVAWILYLYLWLPVITVIAWMAGLRAAYIQIWMGPDNMDWGVLKIIGAAAIIAVCWTIGWAEYNRHKFAGVHRRHPLPSVSDEEVAMALGVSSEMGLSLRTAKCIRLEMSPEALPLGLKTS